MSNFKNQHLNDVVNSHSMAHINTKMEKYLEKREELKDALQKKYGSTVPVRAINSGSHAKDTSINIKFDIDICQPFKKDSFNTLEEMANDVFCFFRDEYEDADLIKVKPQRVSTGLLFLIDNEDVPMDVTPGRELELGGYLKDKFLNLHVKEKNGKEATYTQTNISKHVELIRGKTEERRVIRLLKIWKNKHSPKVKSFFMELITIKAFETNANDLPTDQWGKLKMTMEFIRDKIETTAFLDPANSTNIVSNTMTDAEKKQFSEDMRNALKQIDTNEERIKYYFPVNPKFLNNTNDTKKSSVSSPKHFS